MSDSDPNRPVTGYPAANGYGAHQPPPAGTAYPYAAPPPQHNSFYPNNPYYQQNYPDPDSVRRANFLRRIFAIVIALIIIFGTVTFIVWLVLRPQLPQYRVDSVSISNFTLTNNSQISFTSVIGLTAINPNKKMRLVYEPIDAEIFYRSYMLSGTTVTPFSQGTRSETNLTANFAAVRSFVDRPVLQGIDNDKGRNGVVDFNLRMITRVRFEAKAWRARRRYLRVYCGSLAVSMPNNGTSGILTGGPRQCRVGI